MSWFARLRKRFRRRRPDPPTPPLGGTPFEITADDGATISGISTGTGPAVVLLHCWTGRRQLWASVSDGLVEAGFRVVAYDHRGHGSSSTGQEPISLDRLDADLQLVLDDQDVGRAVVVGHSLGGAVALRRAVTEDRRVAGLVIVASSAVFIPRPLTRMAGRLPALLRNRALRRRTTGRLGRTAVRPTLGFGVSRSAVEQTLEAYLATPPDVVADHLVAIIGVDLRNRLGRISAKTTVVVGTADLVTPARHARRIQRAVPGARLRRLRGAGHMLPLERPTEVVEEILDTAASAGLHSPEISAPQRHDPPLPSNDADRHRSHPS